MAKRQKKKLIFSSYDDLENPYYAGGGARAIFEVAKRLPEYQITVLTGNYPGAKDKRVNNISYKRIGPSFAGPRLGQLIFHFLLRNKIRKEHFDLWIESFTPPFSTSSLQKYTNKPVIGLAHMLTAADMRRKYKLPFHLIEEKGLQTYKNIITITEDTRKKIRQSNPKAKITVIPNGVDMIKSKSKTDSKKNIVFLGRIEINQKGIDLLLEAFAKIVHKTDEMLLIAGSGTEQEEIKLRNLVKEKTLASRVVITGRIEGKDKEKLLQSAKIVVIPSRFETFGNVALEAMAYGRPLVGFAIDGLQWIPGQCMIKAKPFSTDDLAKAMVQIIKNEKLETSMQKAAYATVKKYSWDKTALAYKKIIASIL